jgi:UDP-N-acetylmuramate--alanine ligase
MRSRWGTLHRVHFVGVGGVGMCGLAQVLAAEGCRVSGCDASASVRTELLEERGVTVAIGHDPAHADGQDLMVISAAVPDRLPELLTARERGLKVMRRADLLAEVMRGRLGVAVAGTHGKTTTAALIGHILTALGEDPTVVVGGGVLSLGGYGRSGSGAAMVCEADEYDRAFLSLDPLVAVVTNVEAEHLECYGSEENLHAAFATFIERVPLQGRVILCGDDPGASALAATARAPVWRVGLGADNDWRAAAVTASPEGTAFSARSDAASVDVRLPLSGTHNVTNALAALAVAVDLGCDLDRAAASLADFPGVQRRFQRLGTTRGVAVVDDYAHHPTEIEAVIRAARTAFSGRRLVVVFQPHLFSRTRVFAEAFGRALAGADVAAVMPIFPARETPIEGVDHHLVVRAAEQAGGRAVAVASGSAALDELAAILTGGDVLLTLGAGDVDAVARAWVARGDAA